MIVAVFIGFMVFFFLHAVSLQLLPRPRTMYRVFATLAGSWAGGAMVVLFLSPNVLSAVLLTLSIACYVFGVFVIVDSSIHVRLLLLVAAAGKKGMQKNALHRLYNRDVVVTKRLARLVDAGEIICENKKYRLSRRFSLLMLRERVSGAIECLFP